MKNLLYFNYTEKGHQYRQKLGQKGFKLLQYVFKKFQYDNQLREQCEDYDQAECIGMQVNQELCYFDIVKDNTIEQDLSIVQDIQDTVKIFGSIFVVNLKQKVLVPLAEHLINKIKNNKDFLKDNSNPKDQKFVKNSLQQFGSNQEYSKVQNIQKLLVKAFLSFQFLVVFLEIFFQSFNFQLWTGIYFILKGAILVYILIKQFKKTKYLKVLREIKDQTQTYKVERMGENDIQKNIILEKNEICIGDIIVLEQGYVDLDILILSGNILCDESGYTGSETLVSKKGVFDQQPYNISNENIIYSGSRLESGLIKGVIIGVGQSTLVDTQHSLISKRKNIQSSFLYFITNIIKFLIVVTFVQSLLFYEQIYYRHFGSYEFALKKIYQQIGYIFNTNLLCAILVLLYCLKKWLQKQNIYIKSVEKVLNCSNVKFVGIDKTGTLTQENYEFLGVVLKENFGQQNLISLDDIQDIQIQQSLQNIFWYCNEIKYNWEGEFFGPKIDEVLFKQITNNYQDNKEIQQKEQQQLNSVSNISSISNIQQTLQYNNKDQVKVIKIFQYDKFLRQQGIIISINNQFILYTKGQPLIFREKTNQKKVPENYKLQVKYFASQGHKILATGFWILNKNDIDKNFEQLFKEMEFLAFLVFRNSVGQSTIDTIQEIKDYNKQVFILSGDLIYSCASVAKQIGILNQNGNGFYFGTLFQGSPVFKFQTQFHQEQIYANNKQNQFKENKQEESFDFLLKKCQQYEVGLVITAETFQSISQTLPKSSLRIFLLQLRAVGECSDVQKQDIIRLYQNVFSDSGSQIGYIGNGQNDYLAIQQADLGLIVGSHHEVSGGSFFSKSQDISQFLFLIKETEFFQEILQQTILMLLLLNQHDCINSFFFSMNNIAQLQIHTILQGIIKTFGIVYFVAWITRGPQISGEKKSGNSFGKYEIFVYFFSLFYVIQMYKKMTIMLRTDIAYKSVTETLGYSFYGTLNESHSFTIQVYYSALLYLLIFTCIGFQFGWVKQLGILQSFSFIIFGSFLMCFILLLIFSSFFTETLGTLFRRTFYIQNLNANISVEFLKYYLTCVMILILMIRLTQSVKEYYQKKNEVVKPNESLKIRAV